MIVIGIVRQGEFRLVSDDRLLARSRQFNHLSDTRSVGLDQFEESAHPVSSRFTQIGQPSPQPAMGRQQPGRPGVVDLITLKQRCPMHQQPHGCIQIPLPQQCFRCSGVGPG